MLANNEDRNKVIDILHRLFKIPEGYTTGLIADLVDSIIKASDSQKFTGYKQSKQFNLAATDYYSKIKKGNEIMLKDIKVLGVPNEEILNLIEDIFTVEVKNESESIIKNILISKVCKVLKVLNKNKPKLNTKLNKINISVSAIPNENPINFSMVSIEFTTKLLEKYNSFYDGVLKLITTLENKNQPVFNPSQQIGGFTQESFQRVNEQQEFTNNLELMRNKLHNEIDLYIDVVNKAGFTNESFSTLLTNILSIVK